MQNQMQLLELNKTIKKIMKKLLLILLCLPMIGFGQLSIISNIANEELRNYLEKIPIGQEEKFGFNNRNEFSQYI